MYGATTTEGHSDVVDAPAIRLTKLTKSFGSVTAVDNVSLDVAEGEFFSMLGPSGSGKTTVLRLIAGFETPSSGSVALFGEDVTAEAPFDRNVNTVFQDYALFPHMSVLDNVAYGLRVRGVSKSERRERARAALETVRLGGYGDRKPAQLSGGQRQRVALARATIVQPRVLLLDEPLGALDLKLREQMQVELKEIQRDLGITFIFVTHDQEEALTLSDRVAVFNEGTIVQLGTPQAVYENPDSEFVADFVGTSNVFTGQVASRLFGKVGSFSVRPERMSLHTSASKGALGVVVETVYVGGATRIVVDLEAGQRINVLDSTSEPETVSRLRGKRVSVTWAPGDVVTLTG